MENKAMKILYFDCETTGRSAVKNDIVQLSGMIEIDGVVKEEFNFRCQPFDFSTVEEEALKVTGLTLEDLKSYPLPKEMYTKLVTLLSKYCNKFDKNDKFYPAGYNVSFDLDFLANFFAKNGDKYFGSWVNWKSIDGLPLMRFLEFCGSVRLENQKLGTVCEHFGIEIQAHDALSDIRATRSLIQKLKDSLIYQ